MPRIRPGAAIGPALWLGLLLAASPAPRVARGDQNLEKSIGAAADDVTRFLTSRGIKKVDVSPIRNQDEPPSPGTAMTKILADRLRAASFTVARAGAEVKVSGDFTTRTNTPDRQPVLHINIDVQDMKTRSNIYNTSCDVVGSLTVGTQAGVTADLPRTNTEAARGESVARKLQEPSATVAGARVKSSDDSPYAVEVLVKGRPVPVQIKDGVAFVALKPGDKYQIRLVNDSASDAAVAVSIDGLSLFTFSEMKARGTDRPLYSRLIVPARASWPLKGWHKTDREAFEFVVGQYDDSAAGKELKDTSDPDLGTITATFGAAWREGATPPADEPVLRGAAIGTERGPVVGDVLVPGKYHFGVVRTMITVRYYKQGDG